MSLSITQLQPGVILENRYEIINLIKSGGMGAVYKAQDNKLECICAVKELLPYYGTPEEYKKAIENFQREARILANLDDPNLPKVSDYFIGNNRYYLVMTYIEGEDLETILSKKGDPGLPESMVIEWAKQILKVLDYLHSQTPPIVYRDIKPSNIMLHKDGRIVLIDFGIARAIYPDSQTQKTKIGTDGYAPVEQYMGKVEPGSDIYALGATMHHLLTGQYPIPFKFTPLRNIISNISLEFENIVMKALKEKIADRFLNANDMLQALLTSQNNSKYEMSKHKPNNKNFSENLHNLSKAKTGETIFNPSVNIHMTPEQRDVLLDSMLQSNREIIYRRKFNM